MAKYIMAVHSKAMPGRDADYMEWYKTIHIADICAIPGVLTGHVFETIPASPVQPALTYLAIYELDVDDPTTVLTEIRRRGQSGEMSRTDAVDGASSQFMFYRQNF